MSFTLQLWQKPDDWPWPSSYKEADGQISRLFAQGATGQNPRFIEFGKGLYERFPEETGVWLDGSEAGETDEAVLVFGISTRHDDFTPAYLWAVEVAGRLGLVITDPQTGDTFLPDGRRVDDRGQVTPTPRPAPSAAAAGGISSVRELGWEALRQAAANRQPGAVFELGRRLRYGVDGQRRHLWVSYALLRLGAHDEASRAEADERWGLIGESEQPRLRAIHDRLAAAAGPALLAIVDEERRALDELFARGQREMMDNRTWKAGLDHVHDAAAAGHEVAAYWVAFCAMSTHTPPVWKSFDTWSRVSAEWDHGPAKELRHHVLLRGIGQPDERPDAAKAAWWREQLAAPPREWPREGQPLAQVTAWFAGDGVPFALLTQGAQFERGRAGLKPDLLRAYDCYVRGAEAGDADCTYNVAVLIERWRAPRPLVIALFMIAHSRGSQQRAEGLKVGADEKEAARALMRDLLRPGLMRSVIESQVRLPSPDALAASPSSSPSSSAAPGSGASRSSASTGNASVSRESLARRRREAQEDDAADHVGADGSGASRLWLGLGLVVAPLMMAMARPGLGFRMAMLLGAALGAWGVWRFTARGEWSWPIRLVLAAAAAFPVGGLLVSGLLLARSFRT
ncbi:hypothetical protein AACH06_05565 [Ideonella sp. DXS29W]|uniref:Uncharacterized protein n=1 Tax=Ideonella lacteola TaxID=2984193 RepID=A0ABU9BMX9_9BURK